jgi:ribosomal protein S18 acetylase RimI-like enzyme
MEYKFRKATINDFDFIFNLKKQNFKKYIEEFFEWNEKERKEMYYNNLKNYMGDYNIIVVNNKDIGVFAVDESRDGESYISEISLIEEYQNKGIGTDILNKLLTKNKEKGLKTKLKVFKNSPAKRLYERLGFSIYGENESHYQMEIKEK